MGKNTRIALLCAGLLLALLAGCAKEAPAPAVDLSGDPFCGDWAYNHDPETVVLSLQASGEATYQGEAYTWQRYEGGVRLTGADGSVSDHRCTEEKGELIFYAPAEYTAQDGHDGLVGRWRAENNWSYEFTVKGTFLEDGVLPGHYFVDEAAGTVKLAYNDPLADTLLYYTIDGDRLTVDYPWTMVPVG